MIEYVKTHHKEMEKYISKIESMSFKKKLQDRDKFDMILRHATQEFLYSTRHTFASNFYKELTPRLKLKLVKAILPDI